MIILDNRYKERDYDIVCQYQNESTVYAFKDNKLDIHDNWRTDSILFVPVIPEIPEPDIIYIQTVAPYTTMRNGHLFERQYVVSTMNDRLGPTLKALQYGWTMDGNDLVLGGRSTLENVSLKEFIALDYQTCEDCNAYHPSCNMTPLAIGGAVCDDCKDQYLVCCHCDSLVHPDDATTVDDDIYCPDCRDSQLERCSACGEYFHGDSISDDTTIIGECCWDNYTRCEDCECVIHIDDSYYNERDDRTYCNSCFSEHDFHPIHSYHDGPEPTFHGQGPRYFGFELETDCTSSVHYDVSGLIDMSNNETMFHLEHDGSLCNGFELVSGAFSFDHIMEHKEYWKKICDTLIDEGLRSHDTTTCGFHIHVSRAGIEGGNETISNIVFLYEKFYSQFLKFSRRTENQLNSYAARYVGRDVLSPQEAKAYTKEGHNGNRYRAINLQPRNTIEFRFFKGTLNIDTIMANIQIVNNLIDVANTDMIESITFEDILTYRDYAELKAYAVKRGLVKGE